MDIYFEEAHEEAMDIINFDEDALLDLESVLEYLDDNEDGVSLEL